MSLTCREVTAKRLCGGGLEGSSFFCLSVIWRGVSWLLLFSFGIVFPLWKRQKKPKNLDSRCVHGRTANPQSGMLMGCSLWVCLTPALFLHTSTMLLVSANFHQHDSSYPSLWLPGPRLLRLRKTAYGNVQSRDRRLSYFAHALSMGDAAKTPSFGRPLE